MNKGSFARKVSLAFIATLTAFAGLAPFAPGASAAANYTQVRYAGEDRFDTAALIAGAIAEATPTAVLARADIYPDALTGAFAAAANGDGPMLLTRSDSVPARTLEALEDEGVDNVILLGGPAAISTSVENDLEDAGYTVERIAGANRYQTAIEIAEDGAGIIGTIDGDRSALLSSGENFPDALSGAPLSFAAGLPSLLTPSNLDDAAKASLFEQVVDALNGLDINQVFLLGGPSAVDEDIEEALINEGFAVSRLFGGDRHATSVEIFEFGLDKGIYTNRRFGLARSDTFPDALAYAPLGGRPRTTVTPSSGVADTGGSANGLLLTPRCALASEVEEFILENQATWTEGEILGGVEAICEEVAAEVEELASVGRADITLTSQQVDAGGTITGRITGENIATVTVSGCGISNQAVTRDAEGDFSIDLPDSQTQDCTLTFTTTFTDGSTEVDSFPIDVVAAGDPNVTLNPASGQSGSQSMATYSGNRPAQITDVSSTNCTISNEGSQTQNRTFNVSGAEGTDCVIVTTVTYTDAEGGQDTFQDTFTITGQAQAATATTRPELVSAQVVDTTTQPGPNGVSGDADDFQQTRVRFVFDEPVQGSLNAPNAALFHLIANDPDTRYNGQNAVIDSANGNAVIVTFGFAGASGTGAGEQNLGESQLSGITLSTVDISAVTDNQGQQNPEGDAPIGSGASTTGGQAGITAAPDLLNVQNFRENTTTAAAGDTLVDFTFDEPAFTVDPNGFHLILIDGETDLVCTAVQGSSGGFHASTGTQTITVSCPSTVVLNSGNVARGFVEPATVSDSSADVGAPTAEQECGPAFAGGQRVGGPDPAAPDETATGDPLDPTRTTFGECAGNVNPLQASDSPDVSSGTPDLDAVTLRFADPATGADGVLFDFDEAVLVPGQTPGSAAVANTNFCVYTPAGSGTGDDDNLRCSTTAQRSTVDASQVLANFAANETFVDNAVGGFVLQGAVVEQDGGRPNQEDEEGVTNQNTTTLTPGRTTGPDLTAVRLEVTTRDPFTNDPTGYRAIYTFDEPLANANTALGTPEGNKFRLWLADGTGLTATNCTVGAATGTGATGDNTVICTAYATFTQQTAPVNPAPSGTTATAAQTGSAVAGTVDNAAVTDADQGNQNPEGYEVTTGSTGTPRQA